MESSTPGQALTSTLQGWKKLVEDGAAGPGTDFTESNRTEQCHRRVSDFVENPSVDMFRECWSADSLSDYWQPNAASILQNHSDDLDAIAALFQEIRDATTYDPSWETRFGGSLSGFGLYELYGRLHADNEPIPTTEAARALERLKYDTAKERTEIIETIERFRERYERDVGHVTAGTEYEVPLYAEIDELFRLLVTVDRETINAQVTGPYADLFRPLIGYQMSYDNADSIEWNNVSGLLNDHLEARESGAYDDMTTEHWGGKQIESWKWQFEEYFANTVKAEFTLTDLSPEEVPAFFEVISEPDVEFDVVQNVPQKMMGSRHHLFTWHDLVDHCTENPEVAAVVLSDLFDEELPIEDRLNEFHDFALPILNQEENSRSPGSLLRAVTSLLMYAYPQRYIAFQYQRTDEFFQEYTNIDGLDMGYSSSQYREVTLACQRLLKKLRQHTDEASMIGVQTLIYINHEAD